MQVFFVHLEIAGAAEQQAPCSVTPGAIQGWQTHNGAHGIGTTFDALHAVVQTDGGLGRGAPVFGQGTYQFFIDTAHFCCTVQGPGHSPFAQFSPAEGVLLDVILI